MALAFPDVTPRMPAIKVLVCWLLPMRMVFDSPERPGLPMSILKFPVVRNQPALLPKAMLLSPLVLLKSANAPFAVLE
jgi:hypothetical protein